MFLKAMNLSINIEGKYMELTKNKFLTLLWKIDDEKKGEYIVKICSKEKGEISTIDFKNDKNFNKIDIVNNFLIDNIKDYDSLEIQEYDEHTKNIILGNEIWKNIFNEVTQL